MAAADNRFPWMVPVDGRSFGGLPVDQIRRITRWARAIARRTMTTPWFNTRSGVVHFCIGPDCTVAPHGVAVMDTRTGEPLPEASEDDVCRVIYSARMSEREKDRELAKRQKADKDERENAARKHIEDQRPEAYDRAVHLTDKLKMGRHWKGSALVP